MKTNYFILCCLLFHLSALSQDTIKNLHKKYEFTFQVSGHYKMFFGDNYIRPTPIKNEDEFQTHQYDRFTKTPTFGMSAGILLAHKTQKKFHVTLGLIYSYRRNIFGSNQDTAMKYASNLKINDVVEYDYSYHSIEIPILLAYKIKKITFHIGVHLPLFTFYNARYSYVTNQFPQNPSWVTSEKTISGIDMPIRHIPSLFPSVDIQFSPWETTTTPPSPNIKYDMPLALATFQVMYDYQIKNYAVNPFLGVDFGTKKSLYLKAGVLIPINIRKN